MFRSLCRLTKSDTLKRCIHSISPLNVASAYDGPGKTTVTILNNEQDLGLMINGYSQLGFRLNNDITVLGSMIIFSRSVISWTVTQAEEINEDSLSIFNVLEPKIDILVMGIGDTQKDSSLMRRLLPIIRHQKIQVEVLPTDQACATFNFLCTEGRYVAGAFIPPSVVRPNIDDIVKTKLRYENVYETSW